MSEIVLYRTPGSRSYAALWMLEELGVPYRSALPDGRGGADGYARLNPHRQVPTLTDGAAVVSESPAICMFLADRYGYGTFAPRIDEPERGAYLKWLVYATAVLEPARATQGIAQAQFEPRWGAGWRPLPEVVDVIAAALAGGPWLLGDRFTAADVMLGATIGIGLVSGAMAPHPVLNAYHERLSARPACRRAAELNWPPEMFDSR